MDTIRINITTPQVVTATTCHTCALCSEGQCLAYGQELECDDEGHELRCRLCLDAYPASVPHCARYAALASAHQSCEGGWMGECLTCHLSHLHHRRTGA